MARSFLLPMALLALGACTTQRITPGPSSATASAVDEHAGHDLSGGATHGPAVVSAGQQQGPRIAPGAADAAMRLQTSTRHAEWAMIPTAAGSKDSIAAFVVYPERRDNAPVVIVVHEIFGLSTWVRSVADQLAADGFIAIAPDLLSLERGGATTDTIATATATALIRNVTPDKMNAMVAAVAQYGMALPSARKSYGIVGYCWGGSASFNHAVMNAPGLAASVVYYGSSPADSAIAKVKVPVLGLYGGNDQRVNATIPRADSTMKAIGGTFVSRVYAGAGHGFLRQQADTANAAAARQAWPETVAWFRKYLK
jgi:carboxymethylenebutenolidase